MFKTFMYLFGYIEIGVIIAVVVNAIQISKAKTNNKEIITLQGPLAGVLWPLTIIAVIGFAVAFAFAEVSEFLTITLLKLLKV